MSTVRDWLLEEDADNPGVRYFALTDLLGRPASDPQVAAARQAVMECGPAPAILAAQDAAGWWDKPGPGYARKYRSTVWSLVYLAQLGAGPADPRVRAGGEYLLQNALASTGVFSCSSRDIKMIVVSNATPLIGMAMADRFDLLEQIFGEIYIPPGVYEEVVEEGKERFGAKEVSLASWIHIVEVQDRLAVEVLKDELDKGESEAIVLAREMEADWVLMDERLARRKRESFLRRASGFTQRNRDSSPPFRCASLRLRMTETRKGFPPGCTSTGPCPTRWTLAFLPAPLYVVE